MRCVSDLRLKHPFTALIAGSTGSGKTVLLRNVIREFATLTTIEKPSVKVVYFHGQHQALFDQQISTSVAVKYVYIGDSEAFGEAESLISEHKPDLVCVDDLMTELGSDPQLTSLFTKKSHHLGFSVFFIVQNLFPPGKQMRNLSLNCHYVFIFKNPRDKSQINHFARQVLPGNAAAFYEIYEDATSEAHSYLLYDCTPATPDNLRFRAKITSAEPVKGVTTDFVVYTPNVKITKRK